MCCPRMGSFQIVLLVIALFIYADGAPTVQKGLTTEGLSNDVTFDQSVDVLPAEPIGDGMTQQKRATGVEDNAENVEDTSVKHEPIDEEPKTKKTEDSTIYVKRAVVGEVITEETTVCASNDSSTSNDSIPMELAIADEDAADTEDSNAVEQHVNSFENDVTPVKRAALDKDSSEEAIEKFEDDLVNPNVDESNPVPSKLASEISQFWDTFNSDANDFFTVSSNYEYLKASDPIGNFDRKGKIEMNASNFDKETISEYTINDQNFGNSLFEGDIVLSSDQVSIMKQNPFSRKVFRSYNGVSRRWRVPISYRFDDSLGETTQKLIISAIQFWTDNTCLRFKLRTKDDPDGERREGGVDNEDDVSGDVLIFFKGSGCYSSVGRVGGEQGISIGRGCGHFGIVAHEIGHALGFWHEQSRNDRNNHITVDFENILERFSQNFHRYSEEFTDYLGLPYDYGSVMHYPATSFAADRSMFTIYSKDPNHQHTMGNRLKPSFIDVLQVNKFYECFAVAHCDNKVYGHCKNGGYMNPQTLCTTCVCPSGFGGLDCTSPPAPQSLGHTSSYLVVNEDWMDLDYALKFSDEDKKRELPPGIAHWLLEAPEGSFIEMDFNSTSFSGWCSEGCNHGYLEVKLQQFQTSGYKFCCELPSQTLTSIENTAAIIAYVPDFMTFELRYRFVKSL